MPPFAGSDEHDHAYRAAAAARGQWAIDPVERHSRHRRLPDRARPTSSRRPGPSVEDLPYTEDSDCVGKRDRRRPDHRRERCRPLPPALLRRDRHGGQAVRRQRRALRDADRHGTALRVRSSGLQPARPRPGRRTRWPYLGIAVACTPVAVYSATIAAPNGVEIMAALALWMSLIGLLLARPEHIRGLAANAAVSGAALATLRPLGPLWCLLILGAVLVARPRPARTGHRAPAPTRSAGRRAGRAPQRPAGHGMGSRAWTP